MPDSDRTKSRRPKNSARERVLAAALELFNDLGTAAVSTNHIAKHAGISPGNLYYWFDGKPAIIAALFEQWSEDSAPQEPSDFSAEAVLRALFATAQHNERITHKYRGLARDLLPLLHSDEELASAYRRNYRTRVALLRNTTSALIAAGLLSAPEPPSTIEALITAAWVLNEFTPSFLEELDGESLPPESAQVSHALLSAFLTPNGRQILNTTDPDEDNP